jgi:hypothetical protein
LEAVEALDEELGPPRLLLLLLLPPFLLLPLTPDLLLDRRKRQR